MGASPGLVFRQVPSAADWNSYFAAKADDTALALVAKSGSYTDLINKPVTQGLTPFTPSPASSSGTITTLGTIVANYRRTGNLVEVYLDITITTNGTGAGALNITLPVAVGAVANIIGREAVVTAKMLIGQIFTGSTMAIFNYDGTYPGANGARLVLSGTYSA